ASDTFRAASIEQLEKHANALGVEIVKGKYGQDPASVAFDAIAFAKKRRKNVVLIDTAGRMYTRANLMKEMEKIVRVTNPDLKIFVGESITGNDAVEQAKMFDEVVGIDGSILTKADVDEKAGAILSIGFVTGKPIFFLGTGQGYEDLVEFKKNEVIKSLGLG
ncbi:signal recognition particle-docking protein FtsY, partial [Candidatus Pacearchaeota archaeon]